MTYFNGIYLKPNRRNKLSTKLKTMIEYKGNEQFHILWRAEQFLKKVPKLSHISHDSKLYRRGSYLFGKHRLNESTCDSNSSVVMSVCLLLGCYRELRYLVHFIYSLASVSANYFDIFRTTRDTIEEYFMGVTLIFLKKIVYIKLWVNFVQ